MPTNGATNHYREPGWFTTHVFNKAVARATRLGISIWGSRVLEVRGARSHESSIRLHPSPTTEPVGARPSRATRELSGPVDPGRTAPSSPHHRSGRAPASTACRRRVRKS
jgi:hypothetical protein